MSRKRAGKRLERDRQQKGSKVMKGAGKGQERGSEGAGMGRKEVEKRQEKDRNETGERQRRGMKE
jgi:hypothetical protein